MKPPKNQRISSTRQRKQQHLLDVKIRVGIERERRYRAAGWFVFKAVFFISLAGGAWFGGKEALRVFLWENPDYIVHDVHFTTDGALTREQALTAGEVLEGRNIFAINLGRARAALEKLPQVESVELQRTLPNHLAISVSERRPIAWVTAKKADDPTTSEQAFLIDARGVILRCRVLLPEYYHLPIISGVATGNLVAGQRVNNYDMQAALELVRLNADSTRFQVRNIDLAKGYCMVVTDQRRAEITFRFDRVDTQLARLNRLLDLLEPTKREIQTVSLIPERNVPVTFRDPAADVPPDDQTAPKRDDKDATSKGAQGSGGKSAPDSGKKPGGTSQKIKKASASPGGTPAPANTLKKHFDLNG